MTNSEILEIRRRIASDFETPRRPRLPREAYQLFGLVKDDGHYLELKGKALLAADRTGLRTR